MNRFSLLLKKQMLDALPTRSRKKSLSDWTGTIVMLALVAVMIAVFVTVFSRFASTYTAIKINRVPDVASRQYEIMSIGYFVLIVLFAIFGVSALCHTLFENSDINILISMPFSSAEIFLSKLASVYFRQAILSLVCVPVFNFTFFCTTDTLSVYGGIMTFVVALALPIIPLAIASMIALPFYYLKRLVSTNYILTFIVITALAALFCWGYSYIFRIAQDLLTSGKITTLFNEKVMTGILVFTKYNDPANLFASIMLGRDIGKNVGILLAIIAVALALCLVIVRAIFIRVTHSNINFGIPHAQRTQIRFVKRSRFASLLAKEFMIVTRTADYAYMYLTTAAVMPVMAFYSAKMASSMVVGLFGNEMNLSFEICTFIVILYSTLTNTFCSTNISRDGYMSMTQKTLPYSPASILGSKIVFCAIVAEASLAIACIVLCATGIESVADGIITFIAASAFAFAQIVGATKKDLTNPHFSRAEDGQIRESNSTVSSVLAIGLGMSFLIGFALLFSSFAPLFKGGQPEVNKGASYAIAICLPIAMLGASLGYFFANLKKAYANLDTED